MFKNYGLALNIGGVGGEFIVSLLSFSEADFHWHFKYILQIEFTVSKREDLTLGLPLPPPNILTMALTHITHFKCDICKAEQAS